MITENRLYIGMCNLEITLAGWENVLNKRSAYPIIGVVTGAVKCMIGVIQTVCSVVVALFVLIPAIFNKYCRKLCEYCFVHFMHGLGNITCGFLLALPLVGSTIIYGKIMQEGELDGSYQFFSYPRGKEQLERAKDLAHQDEDGEVTSDNPANLLKL